MRDCGRDIHSLECAVRVTKEPQVPSRQDAVVLPSPHTPLESLGFGHLLGALLCRARCRLRDGFHQRPRPIEPLGGVLEVARNHLGVRQPVRRFGNIFGSPVFFGSCNQLGAYRLGLAHIGTELLNEKDSEECRPGLLPVDARPLAKLQCARLRLLDIMRAETFAIPQRPVDFDPEVQFQFGAPVVVGELVQLFKPLLKLCDRFGIRAKVGALTDRVEVMKMLSQSIPHNAVRLLGVTDADLAVPVLTFLFGQAQLNGPLALVSLCRLHQEFYGLPADPDSLRERTVKEVLHELGHTFGLTHCSERMCAMSLATHIGGVDAKSERYCDHCGLQLVEKFASLGEI